MAAVTSRSSAIASLSEDGGAAGPGDGATSLPAGRHGGARPWRTRRLGGPWRSCRCCGHRRGLGTARVGLSGCERSTGHSSRCVRGAPPVSPPHTHTRFPLFGSCCPGVRGPSRFYPRGVAPSAARLPLLGHPCVPPSPVSPVTLFPSPRWRPRCHRRDSQCPPIPLVSPGVPRSPRYSPTESFPVFSSRYCPPPVSPDPPGVPPQCPPVSPRESPRVPPCPPHPGDPPGVPLQYVENNKRADTDWFRLESNPEGTRCVGRGLRDPPGHTGITPGVPGGPGGLMSCFGGVPGGS